MSNVTLEGIAELLKLELEPINKRLDNIEATQSLHSTALDKLLKNTENWNQEMILMRNRMGKYEEALKAVGQKLNLDLARRDHSGNFVR